MQDRKKLLAMAAIIAGLVYFLFSYFFADVQVNKYSDILAVRDQSAIEKGWIPAILPKSAYDIVETHDIDTNTIFGKFKYKEPDEKLFMGELTDLNDSEDTLQWGNFLFKVDKTTNQVRFRNRPEMR